MNRRLSAMVTAALLAAGSYAAPPRAALADAPLPVALVNVDRVLKTYKPLQEKIDPLKAEAKEIDQTVQVRQAEIQTVSNQLRQQQSGSPEQQRLQLQLVKLQTELQQFVNNERQALQKKEATIYLAFFRQLDAEIAKYAKGHGIKLVLRQSETSLEDGQSLPDTIKAINRSILYEDGIDITDEIVKALDASAAKSADR